MENGPRMIYYNKQYSLPGCKKEEMIIIRTKKEIIEEILKYPAILIKGQRDDLIEFDIKSDEPKVVWKPMFLEILDDFSLRSLLTLIEKRFEAGIK